MSTKKVYIIGSKGIPAKYGGFETFIDRIVTGRKKQIEYVITGMADQRSEYVYNDARCIQFKTGNSAVARMLHTLQALWFVRRDASSDASAKVVYILGCRAGIFLPIFRRTLQKRGVAIFVNPDGAEWKRAKWNPVAKRIVLLFERLLVNNADMVICDSMAIKDIMKNEFHIPEAKLAFAAYGSEIYEAPVLLPTDLWTAHKTWAESHSILNTPYFLMVGRFVPENNYELVIREFMASDVKADLVIISNVSNGKLKTLLYETLKVDTDPRIKLVGTLYDQDVLKVVRSKAVANIHGHEVGGTNPSLLEALGSTQVNLVFDVSFNREVAVDAGLYFNETAGSLAVALHEALALNSDQRSLFEARAKARIRSDYSWPAIIDQYEQLFLENL